MEDKDKNSNWVPTLVSIVIGVAFTIGTAWYTIYSSKEELERADSEKLKNVKENLVAIIEEHIVNKDSLDLKSFERLVTNRVTEEKLKVRPTLYGLLTQAEFNIKNSRHLSFDKKKDYSSLISTLYLQISNDTTLNLKMDKHQADLALILKSFNETSESEGKKALINLINQYESELAELRTKEIDKESITDYIFKSPTRLILITGSYIAIIMAYFYFLKMRRRRRELLKKFEMRSKFESERMREEIERVKDLLSKESLSKEQRRHLEERLEMLMDRLMRNSKENYYRQHGFAAMGDEE